MVGRLEIGDDELIERFFNCENDLFDVFADRYYASFMRRLRGRGEKVEDIEDALQIAFTRMYLTKQQGNRMPAQAFVGMTFNLAKRRRIDQVRKQKTLERHLPDLADAQRSKLATKSAASSDEAHRKRLERAARWIKATRKDPAVMIVGLLSRFSPVRIASLSHGEVAVLLDVSPSTISRRWEAAEERIDKLFPNRNDLI